MKRIKVSDAPRAPKARVKTLPAHRALSQAAGHLSAQDTLFNFVTGMGGEKDKLAGTVFGYAALGKAQLDAAYRGDWISRKVVDIPAYDAFREWRSWEADAKDITAIEELEKKFRLQRKAMLALQRGRLYGGGALVLGIAQGRADEELVLDTLGKDCLQFVHVVSRHEIAAGPIIWDVMSPYYGEPSYYEKTNNSGVSGSLRLHPSRVVRFVGHETADVNTSEGWGDSILQVCADAILACGVVASSVAQMVAESKIDIIKIPELSDNLGDADYEDRLKKRFGLANTIKSVFSMLIIDKEEEWNRINQSFTGLPDILKMYLLIVSGAADVPATRFLSQSPAGLSATGESDTRNYYDRIGTEQSVVITPAMERLDKVLIASALGKIPDETHYEWRPLWQMDPKDEAEIATKKAAVMTADTNAGLITPLVLQKARENQLIEDGTYPGLEGFIDDFGDDIDERVPDIPPGALGVGPDGKPILPAPGALPPAPGKRQAGKPVNTNSRVPAGGAPPQRPTRPPIAARRVDSAMARRMRDASAIGATEWTSLADASTPRTLYVRRDVLNQDAIKAWAKSAGFASSLDDMHVTIIYSKQAVDWLKIGSDDFGYSSSQDGKLTIKAGGPRVLEKFGKAIVLAFASSDLTYRHLSAMRQGEPDGIEWKHDDFTPHITITYKGDALDVLHMEAYQGPIELGPEIFEEIDSGFDNEVHSTES